MQDRRNAGSDALLLNNLHKETILTLEKRRISEPCQESAVSEAGKREMIFSQFSLVGSSSDVVAFVSFVDRGASPNRKIKSVSPQAQTSLYPRSS
jgi:hypothetical protein